MAIRSCLSVNAFQELIEWDQPLSSICDFVIVLVRTNLLFGKTEVDENSCKEYVQLYIHIHTYASIM